MKSKTNNQNGSKKVVRGNQLASSKNNSSKTNQGNNSSTKPTTITSSTPNNEKPNNSNKNPTTTQQNESVLIGDKPLDPYLNELFSTLVDGTKASNALPSQKDFEFLVSHFPDFKGVMDASASSLKDALSSFLGKKSSSSLLEDDPEVMFDSTVDLLDQYFENVDIALDEMELNSSSKRTNGVGVNPSLSSSQSTDQSLKSMSRPQLKWNDVDNSNKPFVPKLKTKPNAFVATLDQSMKVGSMDDDDVMDKKRQVSSTFEQTSLPAFPYRLGVGNGIGGEPTRQSMAHPYMPELMSLEFMPSQYKAPEKIVKFKSLEESACTWISTVDDLHKLASLLEAQDAFAIDLEHHSYRSFQGFVCLMQISTRNEDFLVDTLELREHMHVLNTSFTHPKIVKVMHGADCDVLWLQRDFGLYVVNLFDTGLACRVLGLPGASFAYLLKHYCAVEADKKYQLADWRVRPLPSEMVKYAREDTHYLLYIYDNLRNDLFLGNTHTPSNVGGVERLEDVLARSKELCMRRYEKELFTETSYLTLINKFTRSSQTNEKVIRVLYKWRDTVSRKDDESVRYVLPDHMILGIAQQAPTSVSQLLACCNPVPKLIRRDAKIIVDLITKALNDDTPEHVPTTPSKTNSINNIPDESFINHFAQPSFELESPIANPHYKTPSRMSPVMNTDDLYNIAGWVEKKSFYPSSSISKLTFSEEDNDDLDLDFERRKSNVHVTPSKKSLFLPPTSNLPRNTDKVSKIMSSFSLGGIQQSVIQSSFNKTKQDDDSAMQLDNSNISMMDQSNITDTVMGDETDSFLTSTTTPNPPTKKPTSVRVTPEEERVPLSLNEIYKLSQKNRKRNKQKKKLKQDSVNDPSPAYEDGDDVEEEDVPVPMSNPQLIATDTTTQKPVDFMKKIGWIGSEEDLSASEEEKEEQEVNAAVQIKVPGYSKPNMNSRKKPSKNHVQSKNHKH